MSYKDIATLVEDYYEVTCSQLGDRLFNTIKEIGSPEVNNDGDLVTVLISFSDGQSKRVNVVNQQMFSLTVRECILWDMRTSYVTHQRQMSLESGDYNK